MTAIDKLLAEARKREHAGDLVGAIAVLETAPLALRGDPLCGYARGTLLCRVGRFADAEALFRASHAAAPQSMDFVLNLAVALVAQANADQGSTAARTKAREAVSLLDAALAAGTELDPYELDRRAELRGPAEHLRARARTLALG